MPEDVEAVRYRYRVYQKKSNLRSRSPVPIPSKTNRSQHCSSCWRGSIICHAFQCYRRASKRFCSRDLMLVMPGSMNRSSKRLPSCMRLIIFAQLVDLYVELSGGYWSRRPCSSMYSVHPKDKADVATVGDCKFPGIGEVDERMTDWPLISLSLWLERLLGTHILQ